MTRTPTRRRPLRREDVVFVDRRPTALSLAVRLVDASTGRRPTGTPAVSVEGTDAEPVESRTNYLLFLDLDVVLNDPNDPVTVSVDGGEVYQDAERDVIVVRFRDHPPVEGVDVLHRLRPVVTFELERVTA